MMRGTNQPREIVSRLAKPMVGVSIGALFLALTLSAGAVSHAARLSGSRSARRPRLYSRAGSRRRRKRDAVALLAHAI
jgi:hypothetical protein